MNMAANGYLITGRKQMKWVETTLRKGTKTPKVCRDMFVTDSRGEFEFVIVKNGTIASREVLSVFEADKLISKHNLVPVPVIFNNCYTYRTKASNKLVADLIKNHRSLNN